MFFLPHSVYIGHASLILTDIGDDTRHIIEITVFYLIVTSVMTPQQWWENAPESIAHLGKTVTLPRYHLAPASNNIGNQLLMVINL